jgi:hypothetical protein
VEGWSEEEREETAAAGGIERRWGGCGIGRRRR